MPYQGKQHHAPAGFIRTNNCINRYRTVSCVVLHGVKPTEDPKLAVMWCILGEPICGAAIPLWASAGPVPPEVNGKGSSDINIGIQRQEKRIYSNRNFEQYADTYALVDKKRGLLLKMLAIEKDFINKTNQALTIWRKSNTDIQVIRKFEFDLARRFRLALR